MPVLSYREDLGRRPRRVLVAGVSGSGKTTFARRIARASSYPFVEIDSLYHGPGWTPRPEFQDDIRRFTAQEQWIIEWQYSQVREYLAGQADLLVWLDLPTRVVMRQVTARTAFRRVTGRPLWNGNVERPLHRVFSDPDHIIRGAWQTRHARAADIAALEFSHPDLPVVRLHSHRQMTFWLAGPFTASLFKQD